MTSPDFDPEKRNRNYYRHEMTGDLGWVVRRDHREHMKYDRGADTDLTVAIRRDDKGAVVGWVPEKEPAPLTRFQAAVVAHAADRELFRFTGQPGKAKAWIDLSEEKRRDWIQSGPKEEGTMRQEVYDAVMEALDAYTE